MVNLVRIKITVFVHFCVISFDLFGLCSSLYLNDTCIVSRTSENGICKFIDDCPRIIIEALEQSKYPTLCGFEGTQQIICCPKEILTSRIDTEQNSKPIRISAEKCVEYQRTCNSDSMPFNNVSGDAAPKEFQYNAALGFIDQRNPSEKVFWGCGGSIISEHFVLTAAHCVKSYRRRTPKYVRLGDLNLVSAEDDIGAHQFEIIEIFRHPLYEDSKKYDDIALIKVDGPIEFNDYIRPACLPDINTEISEHLIVAGRGYDYNRTNHLHLQRVQLKLVANAECSDYYSMYIQNKGIVNQTQICAGSNSGEPDTCGGYGGYGLTNTDHKHSCLHEIVGLTAFGASCSIGAPSVFTRLTAYLDWIEDIVWSNGNGSTITTKPDEEPTIEISSTNRRASMKCQEYSNIMSESLKKFGYFNAQDNQNNSQCSLLYKPNIEDDKGRVDAVTIKEFPHMALIGFSSLNNGIRWACGGSLISEHFVLTTAHCLFQRSLGNAKYVLLGDLDYDNDSDDANPLQFNVTERIKHPEFVNESHYNDIGLLRLENAVSFTEYIRPICLPDTSSTDFKAIATGWGRLGRNRSTTTHLQKVELDLFTHEDCNSLYTNLNSRLINQGIINETQICAGSHGSSRGDTCQGDSGGPLQISHNKYPCMRTVVGITSFGALCGSNVPSVYTRVYSFVDWIESVVWPNLTEVHEN